MRVGQSRFEQKSTSELSTNNSNKLLQFLECCQVRPQSQRDQFNMYRINSFLIVLLKAQKMIFNQSIVKNVSCRPSNRDAIKYLSQLDGAQVKGSIMKSMANYTQKLIKRQKQLKKSIGRQINKFNVQNCWKEQEVVRLTNLCLWELMQNMKIDLKSGSIKKQIYGFINFEWTTQFVNKFISYFNLQFQNEAQIENIIEQLKAYPSQEKISKNNQNTLEFVQYQKMNIQQLFNKIANQKLAKTILKYFQSLQIELRDKESKCLILNTKLNESEQIIRKQIDLLNQQYQQNQKLQKQLKMSQSQLQIMNLKCISIQKQLQEMNKQIQAIKPNNQVSKSNYYINPLWQKQQLQQKYYVQIIQLQSDLLIQKEQVQSLVNIALQQIKLSHQLLKDLSAQTFFTCRFDNEILRLLRSCPAFDKINIDEYLIIRDETLFNESPLSMYKSTISTVSEIDNQFKTRNEKQLQNLQNIHQQLRQQKQI